MFDGKKPRALRDLCRHLKRFRKSACFGDPVSCLLRLASCLRRPARRNFISAVLEKRG